MLPRLIATSLVVICLYGVPHTFAEDKFLFSFAEDKADMIAEAKGFAVEGQKLCEEERYSEAIDQFGRSIELSPHAWVYMARAIAWKELEEYDAAIDDCNQAIQLDGDNAVCYTMRGIYSAENRDFNRAIADMTRAIEIDSSNSTHFLCRAMVWRELGKGKLAIADINAALERAPNDVDLVKARAACWDDLNEWKGLLEDAEKIILLEPNKMDGYLFRAEARSCLGEYGLAQQDFLKAISTDETDSAPLRRYADFLASCPDENVRDANEALKLAKSACEMTQWKESRALSAVAYAHYALGQYDQAIEYQSEAVKFADEDDKPDAVEALATYEARTPIVFNRK